VGLAQPSRKPGNSTAVQTAVAQAGQQRRNRRNPAAEPRMRNASARRRQKKRHGRKAVARNQPNRRG